MPIRRSIRLFTILAMLSPLQAAVGYGQISGIVARVSQTAYQDFHLDVENSGLGLYGGPAYNMGMRNRDGWAGPGTLGNQEARLYLQDTMTSLGLGVTTQGSYRNVIGELPGRTTPERIFILGAHYDHLAGDRPGGDDNASGTAGILEAARVLSQYRFASTIRFIGFNAEEDGLLGSKNYVNNYIQPNQQNVLGMVNFDMILRPGSDNGSTVLDVDLSTRTSHAPSVAWGNKYRQAATTYVPSLRVDSRIENEVGGSDQDPFVAAGYPAIFASECTAAELFAGSNIYYHTSQDASDRLANNPNNASGVTYNYAFATDVVRAAVALLAQEAGFLFEVTPCDFNIDGGCNVQDLNLLLQQGPVAGGVTVTPGVNGEFDLTGDGVISNGDVDQWLVDSAARSGLSGPFRRGDANLDGVVDGLDFIQWNGHKFSTTVFWDEGDFNGDGVADGSDFIMWNANKFVPAAAVPEPGTGLLAEVMVGLACLRSRRRGRDQMGPSIAAHAIAAASFEGWLPFRFAAGLLSPFGRRESRSVLLSFQNQLGHADGVFVVGQRHVHRQCRVGVGLFASERVFGHDVDFDLHRRGAGVVQLSRQGQDIPHLDG